MSNDVDDGFEILYANYNTLLAFVNDVKRMRCAQIPGEYCIACSAKQVLESLK